MQLVSLSDGFTFGTVLRKGDVREEGGRRLIRGVAATPERDTQGETLDMSGLDTDYFFKFGKINWEHKKDPAYIIGQPIDGEVTSRKFTIEAELFRGIKHADDAWALAVATADSDRPVLGFSVEGKVVDRDPRDPSRILKAMIVNVALTVNPVNPGTSAYADVVKALATNPNIGADGSALMAQSLEGFNPRERSALAAHLEGRSGCTCLLKGEADTLHHFTECLGAPLAVAGRLARKHRQIAELGLKRS
jgi:hypothetical protein